MCAALVCLPAFAVLGSVSPASAALSGVYESIRQINAILADDLLGNILGGVSIISITSTGDGGYVFLTNSCSLRVDVVYPADMSKEPPGSDDFTLQFEKPICKQP